MLLKEIKKWPFSGGFPDLFLEVLTGIYLLLWFLYKVTKKYPIP